MTIEERRKLRREAHVYVRAAIVELTRASAMLDTRKASEPPDPEFYEVNQALTRCEELSTYFKRRT